MNKRRLFIHCGIHRTGTTSIQLMLSSSRKDLLDEGIIYPFDKENHQDIAWSIYRKRCNISQLRKDLMKQAEDNGAHTVVLSGEDFSIHKDFQWIQQLQTDFDVHCIFYFKRQDRWLTSWYNQHNRWPWDRATRSLSINEFYNQSDKFYWLDYAALLERVNKVVAKENIHVISLDSVYKINLIESFLNIIGINHLSPLFSKTTLKSNESLPAIKIEAIKRIDLFAFSIKDRTKFLYHTQKIHCRDIDNFEFFSISQRERIISDFSDSNFFVANNYSQQPLEYFFDNKKALDKEPSAWLGDATVHDIILTKIIKSIIQDG